MKILLLLFTASLAFAGDWDSLRQIRSDQKTEISTSDGKRIEAAFVSAGDDGLVARTASGDQKVARGEIRKVRVYDAGRRLRRGLLWTAIGAGAGAGAGVAACPSCSNEGQGPKYVGPGVAVGAAIGALGFLSSPYRTVYSVK